MAKAEHKTAARQRPLLTYAGMMKLVNMLDLGAVTSVKNYCSISGARDLKN